MLSFEIIKDPVEWEKMKDQWNDLLEKSITHVPFLRYEFLKQWWMTCGGGEWKNSDMLIVTAWDNKKLVGIAPFFYKINDPGDPSLMLIGSYEISDYLDFIVLPEYLDQFLLDLFGFLTTSEIKKWQDIDLYNLLDYSPTLAAIEKASRLIGWKCESEILQKAPYIPIPGDWDLYLKGIDKKQRHEIRRKMRRLAESGHPNRWYIVENADNAEVEMNAFLDLMENDEEKKTFLTPAMRIQMRETMRCAFDTGCLNLSFLVIDEKKAAGYFSFYYLNRLWVYNSGMNRDFSEFSPGWVLLGYLLQWANNQKIDEFDFLRGDEDYKYKFGAIDRSVVRMRISRE
jgi:hypothetical protein